MDNVLEIQIRDGNPFNSELQINLSRGIFKAMGMYRRGFGHLQKIFQLLRSTGKNKRTLCSALISTWVYENQAVARYTQTIAS